MQKARWKRRRRNSYTTLRVSRFCGSNVTRFCLLASSSRPLVSVLSFLYLVFCFPLRYSSLINKMSDLSGRPPCKGVPIFPTCLNLLAQLFDRAHCVAGCNPPVVRIAHGLSSESTRGCDTQSRLLWMADLWGETAAVDPPATGAVAGSDTNVPQVGSTGGDAAMRAQPSPEASAGRRWIGALQLAKL